MTSQTACDTLLHDLATQLPSEFSVKRERNVCLIVTPFLYPDNTEITLSVRDADDGTLILSDNGESFDYAFLNGVSRIAVQERSRETANRFQIETAGEELTLTTTPDSLASAMFKLVQAARDLGNLVYREELRQNAARRTS